MRSQLAFLLVSVLAATMAVPRYPILAQEQGSPLSLTDRDKEQFLLRAKVVRCRTTPVGITRPLRCTLSDGRLTHDVGFQQVDIRKARYQTPSGTELNFRDYYAYNIAAYRLDRLLNLNMIPPTVKRKIERNSGAASWWVDDVQMMERDRYLKKIQAPNTEKHNDQIYQVRVFNQLVYNNDPNLTNTLITKDWRIWIIDYTRAFRLHKKLRNPDDLVRIDRRVYDGLRSLSEEELQRELGQYLNKGEIRALLARRDLILDYFDEQIAKRGEAAIICDLPGH
jgi:hypothetical protein